MRRRLWMLLLCLVALVMAPRSAEAQRRTVVAVITSDVVEVGESFQIEVRAEVEGDAMPNDAQLRAPSAFQVSGPTTSASGLKLQFGSGPMQMKRTFTARWLLEPTKQGRFEIPAPTVMIGGERVKASGRLSVTVVAGTGRKKKSSRGSRLSPFGGFGNFFGGPRSPLDDIWQDEADDPADLVPRARELMLPKEPQQYVFLRMLADKERAVVGEQVTLSYYVYYRADMKLTDQREPPLTQFLRMETETAARTEAIITSVGRWRYHAKLLDRVAVFPLRAGELRTGTLTAKFTSNRLGGGELARESNDVVVQVREPPKQGRPLGYRIGDVGRFTMAAEVKPRATTVGDTVSVRIRVKGQGLLPNELKIPERTGVEWLPPDKRDEISVGRGDRIGGYRLFGYAVRFKEVGDIQLGTVELPYWDERKKAYRVAKVDLGTVLVQKGSEPAAEETGEDDARDDPFAALAKPRMTLSAYQAHRDEGLSPTTLWSLVALPPLGVAAAQLTLGMARGLNRRRRERKGDPATLARRALADAKGKKDPKDTAAVYERAVHLAVEAATAIKSRGVMRDEVEAKLLEKGLEAEHAREVVDVLARCSALRFDPTPDEEASDLHKEASDLGRRVRKLVKALLD